MARSSPERRTWLPAPFHAAAAAACLAACLAVAGCSGGSGLNAIGAVAGMKNSKLLKLSDQTPLTQDHGDGVTVTAAPFDMPVLAMNNSMISSVTNALQLGGSTGTSDAGSGQHLQFLVTVRGQPATASASQTPTFQLTAGGREVACELSAPAQLAGAVTAANAQAPDADASTDVPAAPAAADAAARQFVVNGPAVAKLTSATTVQLVVTDVITSVDTAGQPLAKQAYTWQYSYLPPSQAKSRTGSTAPRTAAKPVAVVATPAKH